MPRVNVEPVPLQAAVETTLFLQYIASFHTMGTVGNGSRLCSMGNTRDTVSPDSINNGNPPLPAGNNYYYSGVQEAKLPQWDTGLRPLRCWQNN
jgi:hypothetical protein